MKYSKVIFLSVLVAIFITGCGITEETNSSANQPPDELIEPITFSDPGKLRLFLKENKIPNGDIYKKDGKFFINLVNGNDEIKQLIREHSDIPYELHFEDAKFTHDQLKNAQNLLREKEFYQELNLYSSSIDVINNKLTITLPSSSGDKISLIEEVINPELIDFQIQSLGEADILGKVIKINSDKERILIESQSDHEFQIWFSFNKHSVITNQNNEELHFDDLKVDDLVEGWYTGMVLDSKPQQTTGRKVVVLNDQ
jgi:hypothetical protein